MKNFDKDKELDALFEIMSTAGSTIPSDIIGFYNKIKTLLSDIYQKGFEDACKAHKEIEIILNKKEDEI